MIESKDLELTIEKQVPGELITNALKIKEFVEERIKDYTPEKYYDDPEAAKKDRAILNGASKELNNRRLSLEREFMRPFDEFKSIIKDTTNAIDRAAAKLDEVVKAVEETQRNEKRRDIEAIFEKKGFELVPLEKIFDPKWLNKGTKIKDIEKELDGKIAKIYSDIKVIEALPSDVVEVKAQYLDTIDIGSALEMAQRLKANRERLAEEERTREDREHFAKIETQKKELAAEAEREGKEEHIIDMAAEALGVEKDPIIEYTLTFRGTKAQLVALKKYMISLGIEYEKVG